ncbi:NAD(P)-dependent oxidoreductase [Umezawaea tangerina]|uniref:Putative NADH-flavin reductase n=1 Tax=Umezawaea tangerina TaxID=84725 RepID=A0A2T0TH90_9PSEU|nr:SDR family oxidoreductase [Umezawaea tangerina]PRY45066.1 putative NADH-flavin reductase [Umezawaea tangerina]
MRIIVFGATGGVGGHVVRQALDAGHQVTAVVRDPDRFAPRHPALSVLTAPDLSAPPALDPCDAVLSGVGPRGRKEGPVASTAVRGILRAMAAADVRRLVAVSAAPVGPVPEDETFLNRRVLLPFIGAVLRDVYTDLAAMERAMRDSGVEWTAVRPPKLVDKPVTGRYRRVVGGNPRGGYSISRADTAHAMLAALDDPATVRQAVGVAY